jgi:hypothetical protein
MAEPLAHLYELALRALDEQERRVDALRGRLGPVLAAAALGTSLLSGPAVGGGQPPGMLGTIAIIVAILGLLVALCAAAYLLRAGRVTSFDVDVRSLSDDLHHDGLLEDVALFYRSMVAHLSSHRDRNMSTIRRLDGAFTLVLCGILVDQCGLAITAVVR